MNLTQDFTLNDGTHLPRQGMGVFRSDSALLQRNVAVALAAGYRLFDTAAAYQNEADLGRALRESGAARDSYMVSTKLRVEDHGRSATLDAFEKSSEALGLEQIDLYLLHWPWPERFDLSLGSWEAMIELRAQGRIRSLGVCNFEPEHLDRLIDATGVAPVLNQVEHHPFLAQTKVIAKNNALNIITQAWSPIGGVFVNRPQDPNRPFTVLQDSVLGRLSQEKGKTPAQIVLRWHLQRGVATLPKSDRVERLHENIDILDFELSADEIAHISALNADRRGGPHPNDFDPTFLARRAAAEATAKSK